MKGRKSKLIVAIVMCIALAFSLVACQTDTPVDPAPAPAPAPSESSGGDSAPAPAPVEEIVWNLGTINTDPNVMPDLNAWGDMLLYFCEKSNEYTNGALTINVHWGGVLGGNPQLFEQCEMGELDVFSGQPMSSLDPRFACWNIPFQWDNLEQIEKALDGGNGEIYKMAESWIAEHDMHLLSMGASTLRGYANSKHEVILPEDVKGLKSRVYEDELVRTFWDGLTQTQVLPVSDIYSALQTGTVDGLEMHATQLLVGKYGEVVKYYTNIDWQWANSALIIISDKAWNGLTPEQQEGVARAARESAEIQSREQIQFTNDSYALLAEQYGVQVTNLTPEQKQAWVDYANSQTDKYKAIIGEETYDSYMAAVEKAKS